MLPRFSRSIFTILSRRSPAPKAPKQLAAPSSPKPQTQEPSDREMQRYLYQRAKAEDDAIAKSWLRRMFRRPT
ncbi:uncharacterized protein FSUBG_1925 [Fusarium subglutinans]|uniref:Uncharacterized protein n=1 Tax=Gibberella subglutinans TaxID=42677 RepID=A0A8H5V7D7_GIBSU|nr:uncharacterized protein FSUBG_1925 [Fusarium subglutinans]KAF5611898.1 hypothetical protein FSUBG_1925 [Fusarium subglutinans]